MERTLLKHTIAPEQTNLEKTPHEQLSPKETTPKQATPEQPISTRPKNWRQAVRSRSEYEIPRVGPQLATGVTIGCFAGTGYGLAIGMGTVISGSRHTAVIVPSPRSQPFAHDGPMVGAFCGVVAGGGFATGIGAHLGYRWHVFDEWYQAATAVLIHSMTQLSARVRTFFQNPQVRPPLRAQLSMPTLKTRRQICASVPCILNR